jgi:hypothetical protein
MAVSDKEPKSSAELEKMIADLSGLRPNVISVHEIGRQGNFGSKIIAGIGQVSGAGQQSNVEAICNRLPLEIRCIVAVGGSSRSIPLADVRPNSPLLPIVDSKLERNQRPGQIIVLNLHERSPQEFDAAKHSGH